MSPVTNSMLPPTLGTSLRPVDISTKPFCPVTPSAATTAKAPLLPVIVSPT